MHTAQASVSTPASNWPRGSRFLRGLWVVSGGQHSYPDYPVGHSYRSSAEIVCLGPADGNDNSSLAGSGCIGPVARLVEDLAANWKAQSRRDRYRMVDIGLAFRALDRAVENDAGWQSPDQAYNLYQDNWDSRNRVRMQAGLDKGAALAMPAAGHSRYAPAWNSLMKHQILVHPALVIYHH